MATPDGARRLNYADALDRCGVIGVVCPWNLPLLLMTWKVAPRAGLRQHRRREALGGNARHCDAARRE
jgi:hypothetical protein